MREREIEREGDRGREIVSMFVYMIVFTCECVYVSLSVCMIMCLKGRDIQSECENESE